MALELTEAEKITRILQILRTKSNALKNMGHSAVAEGVQIAFTEVATLAITEFGFTLDDIKP